MCQVSPLSGFELLLPFGNVNSGKGSNLGDVGTDCGCEDGEARGGRGEHEPSKLEGLPKNRVSSIP